MTCSQSSKNTTHDILGSIEHRTHQLFIQIPEPWERPYGLSPKVPKGILPILKNFAKKIPSSSVSLISNDQEVSEKIRVLLLVKEEKKTLYKKFEYLFPKKVFEESLHQILILGNRDLPDSIESSTRDYFICTHSKRDACCGVHGESLYKELKNKLDEKALSIRLFRSTHIGGHRYAPTLLEGPQVRCWGLLDYESAKLLITKDAPLEKLLKHYRGSAALKSPYFQLAERELMKEYGWKYFDCSHFEYESSAENMIQDIRVTFRDPHSQTQKRSFEIEKIDSVLLQANCTDEKLSPFPQFKIK